MGCAFRLRRIRETASRFRAIFRVALATNPRKTATRNLTKNRVAVSQALDATLAQGVSPTAGRKGTSPAAFPMTTSAMATSRVKKVPLFKPTKGNDVVLATTTL